MDLAGNVVNPTEIVSQTHEHLSHEKLIIRLTLAISLLAGPALFLFFNAANTNFAQAARGLVLFALTAIAFESTWIIYGFTAMIYKAISEY